MVDGLGPSGVNYWPSIIDDDFDVSKRMHVDALSLDVSICVHLASVAVRDTLQLCELLSGYGDPLMSSRFPKHSDKTCHRAYAAMYEQSPSRLACGDLEMCLGPLEPARVLHACLFANSMALSVVSLIFEMSGCIDFTHSSMYC